MSSAPSDAAVAPHGHITTLRPYDIYIFALSAFAIGALAADSLGSLSPEVHEVLQYTDTILCALFFLDFLRNLVRADNRTRYVLRSGWLDLLSSIPTVGALRLARFVRMARIIRLLRAVRSLRTIGQVISRRRKESALLAATLVSVLFTVFASLAVLQFEQEPGSNIRSGGDALWWAFTTITTVGYGDRFPVTLEGRIVAAMLMAAGVGLFGAMSGLIASWFLGGAQEEETDKVAALTAEVARLGSLIEARLPVTPTR